ncbi:MAG TPA: thiamine ABC transporter substrate-binding protein [Desulfobacteraceae bacterium]|nr:thiamine ABC transporter substrate-binding protein [Desulfobacteraceae bacterium]
MKKHAPGLFLAVVVTLMFFSPTAGEAQSEPSSLTVMTHDSFSVSAGVIQSFEKEHRVKLRFLRSGDAGEALNKAILSRNNPLADVFFGVDNTFLSRALKADIFLPCSPSNLDSVFPGLGLDRENRLVPVDFGDVCINYDRKWFEENRLAPPTGLEDLVKPQYRGLLVVENPATSSPGLAFLLATVAKFGEDGFIGFWKQLKKNDLLVTSGWKEAYWGKFSAASEGDRPLVVSYASSPAAEVFYAEKKMDRAPTGVVIDNGSAFRQIEFAGILKKTDKRAMAETFINFMLSKTFQQDIPLQMFVFPANRHAVLPPVFKNHARITPDPVSISPDIISRKRDTWISQWTEAIL